MTQDLLKVGTLILNGLNGSSHFGGFNPVFAFQFPSLCNQYYKLITFICEIFPEKIPQLPEDLFKSLMFSLELGMTSYPLLPRANALNYSYVCECFLTLYWGRWWDIFPRNVFSLACMIRMSSEISQLCLEALSPLAEQCAKSQDKDMPLFIATRHFLKVHHRGHKKVKLEFILFWFTCLAIKLKGTGRVSLVQLVFDMLVLQKHNMEMTVAAGEAFYTLVCLHQVNKQHLKPSDLTFNLF